MSRNVLSLTIEIVKRRIDSCQKQPCLSNEFFQLESVSIREL